MRETEMTERQPPRMEDADRLYDRFVKPLEQEHRGEFAAVSFQGQTILAPTFLEALQQASEKLAPGNSVVFNVGGKAIGTVR